MEEYTQCYSSNTAAFLLKRIEYGCEGEGYASRIINEDRIDTEDIMKMSALTRAMLDGADYEYNKQRRRDNFILANNLYAGINLIDPTCYMDENTIPMVYPLVVENDNLLRVLLEAKHFQGHWWKYITKELPENTFEHWMSRYVIPITIDQRYGRSEICQVYSVVEKALK